MFRCARSDSVKAILTIVTCSRAKHIIIEADNEGDKVIRFVGLILCFVSVAYQLCAAEIDVHLLRSVATGSPVRQITASADGNRVYTLLENGKVRLYDANGQLQGLFDVGADVTGIIPQGADRLILQMEGQQQFLIVQLSTARQISIEASPRYGDQDAPVAVVVYDDFECPYCAKTVPVLKQLWNRYPKQVKLIFKNFPLQMHKHSRLAALAGLAAHRQGKFWPLHDLMFANHSKLNPQKIRDLALQAGLDMHSFETDLADPGLAAQVDMEIEEGRKIGVRGTPTLFINGRLVERRSVDEMSRMVDAELKRLTEKKNNEG